MCGAYNHFCYRQPVERATDLFSGHSIKINPSPFLTTDSPILELEVKYPAGVLQRTDGRGYMFRLALEWAASEADRANNAFSGELKDDIVLTQKSTQLLKLAVPN
jgi:hypothetical protein